MRNTLILATLFLFAESVLFGDAGFVLVEAGSFSMGSTKGGLDEAPVHEVTITRSFYLAKHEVMFGEYDRFCGATGKSRPNDAHWGRGRRPAIYVSWYDAVEYCIWLSEREGLTPAYRIDKTRKDPNNASDEYDKLKWIVTCDFSANGYRLPTEAEWEYAARGGKENKGCEYAGVNDPELLSEYANFADKNTSFRWSDMDQDDGHGHTAPVGSYKANGLGILDMSGNVWEWCWDWYGTDYYASTPGTDPTGPLSGEGRVMRGGSWSSYAGVLRVAFRFSDRPSAGDGLLGFRLARTGP